MPFNGSGGFDALPPPDFPAVDGTTIRADYFNNVIQDILTGLGQTLTRAGTGAPTANLPMAGFKHTGAASATGAGQYLVWGQSDPASLGGALTVGGQLAVNANQPLVMAPASIVGTYLTMKKGGSSSNLMFLGSDGGAAVAGGSGNDVALVSPLGNIELWPLAGRGVLIGRGDQTATEAFHVVGQSRFAAEGETVALFGTANAILAFYRTGPGTRTGYIGPGGSANQVELSCDVGPVRIYSNNILAATWDNSQNLTLSGNAYPATTGSKDLGSPSLRWNTVWAATADYSGDVAVGGNLAITGLRTTAAQPAFQAAGNNIYAEGVTPTEVAGYISVVNTGSHFNATTGRFTAPVAGRYLFTFQGSVQYDATGVGTLIATFSFRKNGTVSNGVYYHSINIASYGTVSNAATQATAVAVMDLAANDYVSIFTEGAASSGSIFYDHHFVSHFSGHLI